MTKRMSIFKIAIATLILSVAFSANARVDLKNSNYTETWTDMQLGGNGFDLRVVRTYSSRSVFSGMFGYGWCSEFETSIQRTPEGRVKLLECGAGQEVTYRSTKFDEKQLDQIVKQVMDFYQKKNPNATKETLAVLKRQLYEFSDVRIEWAKHIGLKTPEIAKGATFAAEHLEADRLQFDGSVYTRTLADGTQQRFDSNGHMTMINDRNSNFIRLTWADNQLKEVVDNQGRKIVFVYNPNNRKVSEIRGPNQTKAKYEYSGEDLVKSTDQEGQKFSYKYDGDHNLTRVEFPPDKDHKKPTTKIIAYDSKKDWVVGFTDRADAKGVACVEDYKYDFEKGNEDNHYWSVAKRRCGSEVVNEVRYEFWYSQNANGKVYLSRVLNKSMSESTDITYHPEFGRPTLIKKNGIATVYEYHDNGLIRSKSTAGVRMTFDYKNSFLKVSHAKAEFYDAKNKLVRTRKTEFTYDDKGNLATASNSDGQQVKLGYDGRGRIATISDQAKKEVILKYDDRTGRPKELIRPNVGAITLRYKANGELEPPKADGDSTSPLVASQIISTFNNLLDVIGPATSELSL